MDEAVERVNVALRTWSTAFAELGRQYGLHTGMHSSDAAALMQITAAEDRGAPLTQTQLSRRVGLSTPATSSLLDRLERAGHVRRHRGEPDRRTVTLRATEAVHQDVASFFRAVGADLDAVVAQTPEEVLAASAALIEAMTAVLDRHVEGMAGRRAP